MTTRQMPAYKLQKKARLFIAAEPPDDDATIRAVVRLYLLHLMERYEDGETSINSISRSYNTLITMFTTTLEELISTETAYADLRGRQIKQTIEALWQKYSYSSMRTAIMDLRSFSRWAHENDHHAKHIAAIIKPLKNRQSRKRTRAVPPDCPHVHHVRAYLATQLAERELIRRLPKGGALWVAEEGWTLNALKLLRDLFLLTFMYETGIRAGEMSRLGARTLNRVTAEKQRTYDLYAYGKTQERKRLFTESSAELWRIWAAVRPKDETCEHLAVIGWHNGQPPAPFEPNGISAMLKRRCAESELDKAHHFAAQALRSAKARRAIRMFGASVAQHLVDHSLLETTLGYDHVNDSEYERAIIATGVTQAVFA